MRLIIVILITASLIQTILGGPKRCTNKRSANIAINVNNDDGRPSYLSQSEAEPIDIPVPHSADIKQRREASINGIKLTLMMLLAFAVLETGIGVDEWMRANSDIMLQISCILLHTNYINLFLYIISKMFPI